jgi:hypothetical protein
MRLAATLSLFLVVLALSAPGLVPPGELEHNRRLLARWRNDPAHYARLKEDLAAFEALPPERQAALRQLDQELHQLAPAERNRLWHVMDRYATWLEHLPESQRRQVETAPNPTAKLRIIRTLREREWVERLPKAQREQLAKATDEKRRDLLEDLRAQERERRLEWRRAIGTLEEPGWRLPPARVADLPPQIQAFVQRGLLPLLGPEERERLRNAEGQGPLFGRTLLELVDKHPAGLPGPATGPMSPKELPKEVRERLQQIGGREPKVASLHRGFWPDYAIEVTRIIRAHGAMPRELGPCHPEDLPAPVRQFLTDKLLPNLSQKEKQRLAAAEGCWPEYPHEVLQLAGHHNFQVPGVVLPGPRGYWERLRVAVQ